MNSKHPLLDDQNREHLLAELVRREEGNPSPSLSEADESTIRDVKARIETLVGVLRQPPPVDEFAQERDCRDATQWVKHIGERTEFSVDRLELDHIGPYQIMKKLGRGGMGAVFQARHKKLKRVVALKVLSDSRPTNQDATARFEREIEAIGGLRHPNIVAAHDAGEVDGMHYLVMEYVDGLDLSTLVNRLGPLDSADACEIVRQAAIGLRSAHQAGMVHRDIKPSNIMLADGGTESGEPVVKLLDFGLALLAPQDREAELTVSGQIMGTLNYMAPEQGSQSHTVDARADIYSLGATLYRLLSGQPPFADKSSSPWTLVTALATEKPTPLSTLRGDLPPRLVAIVNCMMAKEPNDRYSSAEEVAEALAPWGRGARLAGLLARAREAEDESPRIVTTKINLSKASQQKQTSPQYTKQKRSIPRTTTIAAAISLSLAAVGWLLYSWNVFSPVVNPATHAREVAGWLVTERAEIGVNTIDGRFVNVRPGESLPENFTHVIVANLEGNQALSNEDLARFDKLPMITTLWLSQTNIGDDGLRHLEELPRLQHLFLSQTAVTDAGLKDIRRFPQLEVLHLSDTQVTDAGLEHLADNSMLYDLSVVGCGITDEGLKHLTDLKRLKVLGLNRTGVTPHGIAELQWALPECEIRSDYSQEEIAEALEAIQKESKRSESH